MAKRTTVSDQLRKEILSSPESQAQIARGAGVDRAVLSRFLAKKRDILDGNFSKLCTYLHLELKPEA